MPNQTNIAQINILCTEDSTSNVLVNRSFSPTLDGKFGLFGTYIVDPTAGPTPLPFPSGVTTIYNAYFRNLAPLGGQNINLQITWTTNATPTQICLTPGDIELYWTNQNTVVLAGVGISAVAFTGDAGGGGNVLEYFLGA